MAKRPAPKDVPHAHELLDLDAAEASHLSTEALERAGIRADVKRLLGANPEGSLFVPYSHGGGGHAIPVTTRAMDVGRRTVFKVDHARRTYRCIRTLHGELCFFGPTLKRCEVVYTVQVTVTGSFNEETWANIWACAAAWLGNPVRDPLPENAEWELKKHIAECAGVELRRLFNVSILRRTECP